VAAVKARDANLAVSVLARHRDNAVAALRPVMEHAADSTDMTLS
jgi:molybdopterin synthase catalytic subunit